MDRREFLKTLGAGGAAVVGSSLLSCVGKKVTDEGVATDDYTKQLEPPVGQMTYRTYPNLPDKVSLLGYGMMRLPEASPEGRLEGSPVGSIDQEQVNRLVDYAIEHGVNYFDTSPVYCQGMSERSTGIALKRHPRDKFYVATKLSNFSPDAWKREEAIAMYHRSMKELQVDYIDYYLLHGVGGGGMENLHARYLDNGVLDYLFEERKAGRIRRLGWSYHGEIEVFDWLLENNDKYHWDFVQIQMNYMDWGYANKINPRNTNAEYLYNECWKRGIPVVIMEPLLGGRLANLPNYVVGKMKQREPERSVASWAFRYCGSYEGVLTALSGMTYMEHLKDNLLSYCPLKPLTEEEIEFLHEVAAEVCEMENIPCTACAYCMPCPYGIDIPGLFTHYNKCKNNGTLPTNNQSKEYARLRREYLIGLDRTVPKLRQADHCIGCHQCEEHCPQNIRIAREMNKISLFVEQLKQESE